ncbi:MAG: hypothetical protein JWL90_545 [Chthoniobacteraceae bacterium]|nr:hypothetical protein [Chthoniobacteraceae bacterium]
MKKSLIKSFVLTLVAATLPLASFADKKTEAGAVEAPKAAETKTAESGAKVPYHGTISAVDATAKTFTIKGKEKERVFHITDSTKITKDGAASDLNSLTAGQEVRGQISKNGDKWDAVSVMTGAKAEAPKADAGKSPEATAEKKK